MPGILQSLSASFDLTREKFDFPKTGCPAWIRTMTRRVKVACATITPPGKESRANQAPVPRGVKGDSVAPLEACHGKSQRGLPGSTDGRARVLTVLG